MSAVLLAAATAWAQDSAARPTLSAVRIASPPRIDGRLDDVSWRGAAEIRSFVQQEPVEGAPATERTDVWVAYDDKRIYIGIHAHYSDPAMIRANRADRDQTANDDTVTVSFDPFRDAQRAYAFSVNAYGVQADSLLISNPAGTTTDTTWNVLYESAGVLVDGGWTAEMAIPIQSLRYPGVEAGAAHRWGLQVQREIRGKNETVTWAPLSSNVIAALGQMGTLEGLRDLASQRTFELMPTATSQHVQSRAAARSVDAQVNEAGLNVKYGVTSNLTVDITVNPDFSQIESDRPQIQVNQRFPLFFAELRPFFLEGQDVFRTNGPFPFLHTRTIIDPQFGAKLTGKVGKLTVGALVANDEAPGKVDDPTDPAFDRKATMAALRLRFDVYRESHSGLLLVDREFLDGHSRVAMVDNNLRLGRSRTLGVTAVLTNHRDGAGTTRTGHFVDVGFVAQDRHLGYLAAIHATSPDYRNDSGFVQRTDQRRMFGQASYRWWPEGAVVNWGPRVNYERSFDYAGTLTDEIRGVTLNALLARDIKLSASVNRNMERYGGIAFDKTRASASATINSSRRLTVTADWNRGDEIRFVAAPFLGRTTAYNASVVVRPTSRFQSELRLNTTRFLDVRTNTPAFDVKIVYARTTYQLTERLLLRNILEANTLDETLGLNLLATYRVNAGTVFFVGYDGRYREGSALTPASAEGGYQRTNRAVFAKVQYLYRR